MNRSTDPASAGMPLPADLAALWGAFLFEGLMVSSREPDRGRRVLDAWNQGCLELIWQCCTYLPEVWRQVELRWRDSAYGFPGVFEYEVISELGTMLGEHVILNDGQLPDVEKARTLIRVLIADFFSRESGQEGIKDR
ncbi:MAG: hypothetical protein ACOY3X_13505 [Pseudomonadota bacterium]